MLFYGHEETLSLNRIYASGTLRARSVNYRHVIHSLAKKPNAFRSSQLRDDLIPTGDFTLLWKKLNQDGLTDADCKYMVDLLLLADNYDCEASLSRHVLSKFETNSIPSIKQCRALFGADKVEVPIIFTQQHNLNSYDSLIGGLNG